MERLGEVDEAHDLLARVRRPGAAVMERIARHQRHGDAVEAGEAGDDGAAEHAAHLEERALVDDRLDDGPHLVDLAAIARHVCEQLRVGARDRIGALRARRDLVDRLRHVG